jgi:PLP dependent protein
MKYRWFGGSRTTTSTCVSASVTFLGLWLAHEMNVPMTSLDADRLAQNLRQVRHRIEAACLDAGRSPADVVLIAVTKYAPLEWVRHLVELGVVDLGESRPQQLLARAVEFPATIRWHQIGHLQRNKVEGLLPVVHRIHSVDSLRLIDQLAKAARVTNTRPRLLLEVNVSGEASKDGFDPRELIEAWPTLSTLTDITIDGLMTMAPLTESNAAASLTFQGLRELRDKLAESSAGRLPLAHLSMGMSGDFEAGIREGATFVRIGSSLFEGLTPPESVGD